MEKLTATCPKCQEQVTKLGPEYMTAHGTRYIICEKCAQGDKLVISVTVKRGAETLVDIKGAGVSPKLITMGDIHMVYEIEAFMERLTGYRWHIFMTEKANADNVQD